MSDKECISIKGNVKDKPVEHPVFKTCDTRCIKTITVTNNSITNEPVTE